MTRVAIYGATSAIAQETAKCFAAEGASFLLVARDAAKLAAVAADLSVRGASAVETIAADLGDVSCHAELMRDAGIVLIAHGTLPDQKAIDPDPAAQVDAFSLNATSPISLAAHAAVMLERRRGGTLAVIGSVAGDRGRRSNYVYGSAKAALHAYCQGLRGRLRESGVNVLVIKPGWVDTPMTATMRKNPLFASAASVGRGICDAIRARRGVAYVPWFWKWISLIVRLLPERFVKF